MPLVLCISVQRTRLDSGSLQSGKTVLSASKAQHGDLQITGRCTSPSQLAVPVDFHSKCVCLPNESISS